MMNDELSQDSERKRTFIISEILKIFAFSRIMNGNSHLNSSIVSESAFEQNLSETNIFLVSLKREYSYHIVTQTHRSPETPPPTMIFFFCEKMKKTQIKIGERELYVHAG